MKTIAYPHIEINSDGVALVSGTTTKVIEIVQDHLAHHWDAEDICKQFPYLNFAQVYAALTYYYDNQEEMDVEIKRRWDRAAAIRAKIGDTKLRDKLRERGDLS